MLKLFATSVRQGVHIVVEQEGRSCFDEVHDLTPEAVFEAAVPVTGTARGVYPDHRCPGKISADLGA